MRNIAQFTSAGGGRIGIPNLGALIVLNTIISPLEGQPLGARTLVRYIVVGDQGSRIAWLKDPYKHVISKLPVSACGPWAHATDAAGNDIAFPQGCVGAYEEQAEETINVSLAIPTGPVDVCLRGNAKLLGEISGIEIAESEPDSSFVAPAPQPREG